MAIFLGIDGGGSKTSCLIGDENSVLGSGAAAGSNIVRVGETKTREALTTAIEQACSVAGVAPSQINRTCMGLAGAGQPEIASLAQRVVSEIVSGEILLVGDTVITLEAAFGNGAGVIVTAGTGSIAYGRNSRGETARAGGWGYAVSDEGSGHWIGREAVAAALRAGDQSDAPDSVLMTELMKFWRVETRSQLVLAANTSPAPDFAALLPAVLAAADSGDLDARNVLARAGSELAALAGMVVHRVFRDDEIVPVAMSGGVFSNSAQVCQAFYNALRSRATIQTDIVDPVRGALHLARKGLRGR
jgi:glucosamine kinase